MFSLSPHRWRPFMTSAGAVICDTPGWLSGENMQKSRSCWVFTICSASPGQRPSTPPGLMRVSELCPWPVPNAARGAGGTCTLTMGTGHENRLSNPTDTQAKLPVTGTINKDNFYVFSYR